MEKKKQNINLWIFPFIGKKTEIISAMNGLKIKNRIKTIPKKYPSLLRIIFVENGITLQSSTRIFIS